MLTNFEKRRASRWVDRHRHELQLPVVDSERASGAEGLEQIKHIVILMMENHSYDNYFGMLEGRGDGFTLDAARRPVDPFDNKNEAGTSVGLYHPTSTVQDGGVPSQSWAASHLQYANGACDGFVTSLQKTLVTDHPEAGMAYFDEQDLPFYYSLAKTFPLASRWFCSCLGPTFPNRRFLVAGTAHGLVDDFELALLDYPPAGTIFDHLTAHGISWANYHNKPFAKTVLKALFGKVGLTLARRVGLLLAGLVPRLEQFATGEFQYCLDTFPRGLLRTLNHARPLWEFFQRAEHGTLPSVSIVDPDYGNFSEEDPQDVQIGEGFAAAVIDAVMKGPGWPNTLLFWLYDEHGGYYDHVPPPGATPPDDVPAQGFPEQHPWIVRLPVLKRKFAPLDTADAGPHTYDHYGFRVPAVVVSPFARPGFVTEQVHDHTSILRLIEEKWNLPAMTRRDAGATSPLEMLDFGSPAAFLEPPVLAAAAQPDAWRKSLR